MVTMAFHIGSAPHSPTLINSLSPQIHLRTFNPSSSSSSSSPSPKVRCIQVKSESHFPVRSRRQPDVASQNLNNCSRKRGHLVAVRSQTKMEQKPVSDNRMLVFVPPHPLIKHWISVLRNELTPCPVFKNAMAELGRLLIYEASRDWLPTISGEIQSPLGVANVEFVDPREPVAVIPILRAGLALAEYASSILPATKTYHLGASRDEETLETTIYLNKLPEAFSEGSKAFVVDPMLATGNTMIAALNLLKERGLTNKQIKVISALACPPALQKLNDNFPGLHVYTGMIDPTLNDKGWIIPGLGDAGDRSFGTE